MYFERDPLSSSEVQHSVSLGKGRVRQVGLYSTEIEHRRPSETRIAQGYEEDVPSKCRARLEGESVDSLQLRHLTPLEEDNNDPPSSSSRRRSSGVSISSSCLRFRLVIFGGGGTAEPNGFTVEGPA